MTDSPISRVTYRTFLLSILFMFISYNFALNFARTGHYYLLPLQDYIDGRAGLPFQYRILMAPIFKALLQFFNGIDVQGHFSNIPSFITTPDALTYAVVNFVGFFCAMALFHQIARVAFESDIEVFWSDFLFVVTTYSIFILNPNLNFILPYDLPSLALMQLCTLFVLQRKWTLLILAFIVTTINRETSFIIVVFLACRILFGLEPRRISALLAASALATIWVIIKVILFLSFAGTGLNGGVAEFTLPDNVAILLKPWQWPNLLPLALPFFLCISVSLCRPGRIALAWSGTYLLGFVALFVVANILEQRAYADLIGFSVIVTVFFLDQRGLISPAKD